MFATSQAIGLLGLTVWFVMLYFLANSIGRNYDQFSLLAKLVYWCITPLFFVGPILIGLAVGKTFPQKPWLSGFTAGMLFVIVFIAISAAKDHLAGFVMFGGTWILVVPILTFAGGLAAGESRVPQ